MPNKIDYAMSNASYESRTSGTRNLTDGINRLKDNTTSTVDKISALVKNTNDFLNKKQEEHLQDMYLQQQTDEATLQKDLKVATYEQKQELLNNYKGKYGDVYLGDDELSKKLKLHTHEYTSNLEGNINVEGKDIEFNNLHTDLNLATLDIKNKIEQAGTLGEKGDLAQEYYNNYVTPLEKSKDIRHKNLYAKAKSNYDNFVNSNTTLYKIQGDNTITDNILTTIQSGLETNGMMDKDTIKFAKQNARRLSSYGKDAGGTLNAIDGNLIKAVTSYYDRDDVPKTYDNLKKYKESIDNLIEDNKNIKGKPYYNRVLKSINDFSSYVTKDTQNSIMNEVKDNETMTSSVQSSIDDAVSKGLLNKKAGNMLLEQKKKNIVSYQNHIKLDVALTNNDTGVLKKFVTSNPKETYKQIESSLDDQFKVIAANSDEATANDFVLGRRQELRSDGIYVKSIASVDNALKGPRKVGVSGEHLKSFINTFESAKNYNYNNITDQQRSDYAVLKGWSSLGLGGVEEAWSKYKSSSKKVDPEEAEEAFLQIVDSDDMFSENIHPRQLNAMRSSIMPILTAYKRAGIDLEDGADALEDVIDTKYIRSDMGFGGGNEILIMKDPRSKIIDDTTYKRALDLVGEELGKDVSIDYFAPVDHFKPTGNWLLVDDKGVQTIVPYSEIDKLPI